jgi:hypothetical protein
MRKVDRFQTAMGVALLLTGVLVVLLLNAPDTAVQRFIRAVGAGVSTTIVIAYINAVNPLPFFRGTAKSENVTGAGMVFFAVAIIILVGRPAFFNTVCAMGTECYNWSIAASFVFFVLGGMCKIAGPLVFEDMSRSTRIRIFVGIAIGLGVAVAAYLTVS